MIKKIIVFLFTAFIHITSASEQKHSMIELENGIKKHTEEKNAQNNLRKHLLKEDFIRSGLFEYYKNEAIKEKEKNPKERFKTVSRFGDYIVKLERTLFPKELFVDDYQEFKDYFLI